MTEAEAQAALAEIALELVAIADRLERVLDALPPSRNRQAMLEHRIAYYVATELAGTIECVVADQLRPAMEYLEAASRVTAEELREQHRESNRTRGCALGAWMQTGPVEILRCSQTCTSANK